MTDKAPDDKNHENFPIIGGGNNCDCDSNECGPSGSLPQESHKGIKTAIFIIVLLSAVAVGAYSLIGNHADIDTAPTAIGESLVFDILDLGRQEFATDLLGEDEFVYLTLGGAGAALKNNDRVKSLVENTAVLIRQKGIRIKTASAFPGDSIFSRVVDLFDISGLPAVLAIKKDGNPFIIDSNITENTLLTAYLTGCNPSAECAPGCDPKDCDN